MTKRALVLGCQTYGLSAVLGDVERVASVIDELGFVVERCAGDGATRAGILDAFRRMIEASTTHDVAFVYYSGHGAWSVDQASPGPVQYIVPVDFEASSEHDFRGITAPELSALLGELTVRTRNVTVVLDCCFASGMARGPGPMIKALELPPRLRVAPHLQRLHERGLSLEGPDVESNPHVVRLVASGADQPAYEHTTQDGARTGILTESFLTTLQESRGLRISWAALGRRVRERVMARFPMQRPEIEGPIRRALFELEELHREHALAYFREEGGHWIRGGRILGVTEGDEYSVMPLEALGPSPERRLAHATVVEVSGEKSRVMLDRPGSHLPEGAPAFLARSTLPRRPVRVEAARGQPAETLESALRARIQGSRHLRLEVPGEGSPLVGKVHLGSGDLLVLDGEDDPVALPLPATAAEIAEAVHRLEDLAQAQAMRSLEDGTGESFLRARPELEWGRVVAGSERALPPLGALVREGERVYLRLHNPSNVPLYASVFDVGVAGRIRLLSRSQPSGLSLDPGQTHVLGRRSNGRWEGLLLEWPKDVPRAGARLESLIVVVSNAPQDLRALETEGARAVLQGLRPPSPLAYAVQHRSFWLSPSAPSGLPHAPDE